MRPTPARIHEAAVIPDLSSIEQAEPIVRRFFPPTPLLEARRLSRRFGVPIHLKLDCFTPIRTFKLRGALVKMHALEAAGVTGAVVTASAGNHGLAVARAARLFGRRATVVVPQGANPQKVEAIAAEGAEVIHDGIDYQAAFDHCQQLAAERGGTVVHAYDDPHIIAGQGTLGLELEPCDTFLCGIGGGGLISGVATALKARFPSVRVIGVQPEGADSMARSLEAGGIVGIDQARTLADGLGARRPGVLTWELTRRYVERVVRVPDEALVEAMRILLREERIVAEPAGSAGLAALLQTPALAVGRVVVAVTGANISDEVLARVMSG
jgi:threonine dehydratase